MGMDIKMNEHDKQTFLMWSKKDVYKQKLSKSLEKIKKFVDNYKCVCAYSGGKDSTVMTHMVLQVDPTVTVFHWDHGSWLMPRHIESEIMENLISLGADNVVAVSSRRLETPKARTDWRIWYPTFWGTLAKLRKEYGWEKNFVGLRREEGTKRKAKIDKHNIKWEVYPIADWTWLDIWAYIIANDLPYPKMYDVYGQALGWANARFVTFFDMEFEKFGGPYLDGFFFPQYRNNER